MWTAKSSTNTEKHEDLQPTDGTEKHFTIPNYLRMDVEDRLLELPM